MNTHDLLEKRLENIRLSPELQAQVHARIHPQRVSPRMRLLPALALAVALTLLAGVALAYSQGLFGALASRIGGSMETQLTSLDENASFIGVTHVVPASGAYSQATVAIDQAYYDGQSLYIAYSVASADQLDSSDTENGGPKTWIAPPASLDGFEKVSDSALEVGLFTDEELARIDEALSHGESVCIQSLSQGLSDTPETTDGEWIPPHMGDAMTENGVYSAWMKFESPLPETLCGLDSLSVRYDFIRVTTTLLVTADGVFMKWDYEEPMAIEFTVPRTAETRTLYAQETHTALDAQGAQTPYTLEASLTCSSVSLEAAVTLSGVPDAWIDALEDDSIWDSPAPWHPPIRFSLYAGDEGIAPTDGSMTYDAQTRTIVYHFATVPCSADTYTLRALFADETRTDAYEITLCAQE